MSVPIVVVPDTPSPGFFTLEAEAISILARQGHVNSQYLYGCYLLNGDGVVQNQSLAVHYFKLAADQGHDGA
jgi:TPR repeat protein